MKKKEELANSISETISQSMDCVDVNYCSDFTTHCNFKDVETVKTYVYPKLVELVKQGYHVVSSILTHPNSVIRTASFMLIDEDEDNILPKNYKLRLLSESERPEGTLVPIHNPNGALVPLNKRGKVLAAETFMRGNGKILTPQEAEKYTTKMFRSAQIKAAADYNFPEAPYLFVEIAESPVVVSKDQAVAILQRYGNGINESSKNWLVAELPSV